MSKGLLKLLTLMMVVVLVVGLAAGCKKDPAVDPTEKPDPTETPDQTEEPEEIRDLDGRVIKVGAWWDMSPDEGSPFGAKQAARREEMQEKYNFEFEFVSTEWEMVNETYSSSVLAGEPWADIATLEDNWLVSHVRLKEVTPLNDLFDLSDEKWDTLTKEITTIDGKTYGVASGKWWPRAMFFFNKRIFDDAGIPYPYELLESKEWTWDKVEEYAKKLTLDLDNDGTIDQWGLGGIDMDVAMVFANGSEMITYENGVGTVNLRDPKAVTALERFYKWRHTDGILYNKFDYQGEEIPWDIAKQEFQNGKIAMFWYQYWSADDFYEGMADDYGIMLPPIGPDDPDNNYKALVTGHNFQTIPANVANVDDVAFIWNKWTEPFEDDDEDAWKEGHETKLRDLESYDVLEYMYENDCYVSIGLFGSSGAHKPWWTAQDDLLKGEKTVAEIIDEQFDALQGVVDDFLSDEEADEEADE